MHIVGHDERDLARLGNITNGVHPWLFAKLEACPVAVPPIEDEIFLIYEKWAAAGD